MHIYHRPGVRLTDLEGRRKIIQQKHFKKNVPNTHALCTLIQQNMSK